MTVKWGMTITYFGLKNTKNTRFQNPYPSATGSKAQSPSTARRELFHTQQTLANAPNRSLELQKDLRITTCVPRDAICTGCASICPIPNIEILIV